MILTSCAPSNFILYCDAGYSLHTFLAQSLTQNKGNSLSFLACSFVLKTHSMSLNTAVANVFYLQATDARFFDALWSTCTPAEHASYADLHLLNSVPYRHRCEPLSAQAIHTADVCFELVQRGLSADLRLAPLLAQRAGIAIAQEDIIQAQSATWLRLTPVYWAAERDHVNVHPFYGDIMSAQDEADWQAIFQTVTPWLAELGWTLHPVASEAVAYVRASAGFDYHAPSLDYAQSDILEAFLPSGRDLKRWQKLLTELQMLLHTHPVNQARVARGERPINSLWLDQCARAEQIPATVLAQFENISPTVPRITFAQTLPELAHHFAPVAQSLRAGQTAHLRILSDTPSACVHHFEFTPLSFWQKLKAKIGTSTNSATPFNWLTQNCCEIGV